MKVKLTGPYIADRKYNAGEVIEVSKETYEYFSRKWPGSMIAVEEKKPKVDDGQ